MKTPFQLLFFLAVLSSQLFAVDDVCAEYKMSGIGGKIFYSKIYIKNGERRTEVKMDMGGREITTTTLNLKSNPDVSLVFNSQTKTYTENKKSKNTSDSNDITITVLANEKIGAYNCHHVRMTSHNNSWEMWLTKDLPNFDFSIENDNDAANIEMKNLLKSKGVDGVPVKISFLKPGTNETTMTMELVKYENKLLDDSLFKIPDGYTKSAMQFDAEKMKTMTDEEKKEMIKKLMEQYAPKE